MKKIILLGSLALSMFMASCGDGATIDKPYNKGINLTPMPLELTQQDGLFTISDKVVFVSANEDVTKVASFFASKINTSTGYNLKIQNTKPSSNYISLEIVADAAVNDEGYLLVSTAEGVVIQAKTTKGLFYGMQTVLQLLPAEIESPTNVKHIAWTLPTVTIKDEPRFQYRGQHLDVCRHFASVDFIKKQLDLLAMFKINTLHWHLTEDQAWRIEIKKYPELTTQGGVRTEGDGSTYGPYFYTQEQIKEVVAYAKDRFIEVIPELELPGHAVAAAKAYPNLICTGENIDVRNYWGVSADVFCAGNEEVFTFLEDVIAEMVPLFDSKYFHIGGDECLKLRWEKCPKCQARIKAEGIKADKDHTAEQKLQSYFVTRISKVVEKHGKVMIGWDEILEGGLPESAAVMSWTGEKAGVIAGNQGHDVIMTPSDYMYLDKYQGDSKVLPVTIGGLLTLKKLYSYNPIPEGLAEDKHHHVLGVQANNWTEYKYTEADMQHDVFPRIIALAEVGWTALDHKDYKDFERRIDNQRVRLDMHDVNYYIPRPQSVGAPSSNNVAFLDKATLAFETTEPVKMVYTTDGSEPTLTSAEYKEPLTFRENTTLKIRSVLMSEKMGETRTIDINKQTLAPAIEKPADAKAGMLVEYYKGKSLRLKDIEGKTPSETEYVALPQGAKHRIKGYLEVYDKDVYTTVITGYINIPEDGVYFLSTDYELWIDDKHVITHEADVTKARRFSGNDASLALAKGYHKYKQVRLGATFGGWPTQWDFMYLQLRKDGDKAFKIADESYFK